jgi:hypothetical protein
MKFRVLWGVLPCSQVGVDQRFRGAYCLHHQLETYLALFSMVTQMIEKRDTCMMQGISPHEIRMLYYDF